MDTKQGLGYDFSIVRGFGTKLIDKRSPLPRAARRKRKRRRKTVALPRKNRPFKDVERMSLECCKKYTCLEKTGREIIKRIRQKFDKMLYEAQNNYLISLIDVAPRHSIKRALIRYSIRDSSGLAKVSICKTAFLKIFGVGKKRIRILLSKLQPYTGQIEEDQRQRYSRNQRKIPLALKAEVVEHIQGYERELSHYGRRKTKDKEFLSPDLCLAKLWRGFLEKKQLFPYEVPLPFSYSWFSNIFKQFNLSFRKPRVDTCPRCDTYLIVMKYSNDESEIEEARVMKREHLRQAQEHYDCIKYDLRNLLKQKNDGDNVCEWAKPPLWKR